MVSRGQGTYWSSYSGNGATIAPIDSYGLFTPCMAVPECQQHRTGATSGGGWHQTGSDECPLPEAHGTVRCVAVVSRGGRRSRQPSTSSGVSSGQSKLACARHSLIPCQKSLPATPDSRRSYPRLETRTATHFPRRVMCTASSVLGFMNQSRQCVSSLGDGYFGHDFTSMMANNMAILHESWDRAGVTGQRTPPPPTQRQRRGAVNRCYNLRESCGDCTSTNDPTGRSSTGSPKRWRMRWPTSGTGRAASSGAWRPSVSTCGARRCSARWSRTW